MFLLWPLILLLSAVQLRAEPLALGAGIFSPSLNVIVGIKNNDSNEIRFVPNNSSSKNFIFSFGNLGFSLSQGNKLSGDQLQIPFKSSYEDYQLSFLTGKRNYFAYYQRYKSYYIENASRVNSGYSSTSPESLYKDMGSLNVGLKYVHVYSPERFSLDSSYGISEKQSASGGSWLLSVGLTKGNIESPTMGFAPSYASSSFDYMKTLRSINTTSMTSEGGYSHTWVKSNYFANLILMLGLSYQEQSVSNDVGNSKSTKVASSGTMGLSFGYNSDFHKLSFQIMGFTHRAVIKENRIDANLINTGLVYAYRFGDYEVPVLSQLSKLFD